MEKTRTIRTWGSFLLLLLLLFVFLIWNVLAGSVKLPVSEILEILRGRGDGTQSRILLQIRLPRLLSALILGGALSVSGYLLQTFFHNPIAGPFVLGISSGAKLCVSIVMILLLSRGLVSSSAVLIAAAFVGAMGSMGFVLAVSQKVKRMSMLVICGVMIGYICTAATDLLVTFADDSNIVNLHNWSMGSFSGMSWENVGTMAIVCGAALVLVFFLSKPIRAYQLGEVYAQNLGVPLKAFRAALILLSSVLSACVTAFAGPISFVGIAVPHLMKTLFHSAEPLIMLPACFLGGGVFCLFCDLIARTAFAPTEVSISSVTAIFGAPIVIYMMIHRKAA
ncbi:Vitamin B12 ABC transporter, permease protein BtuC [Oscillospiraceae bacterium]|nr:Vitamin B12 ABC transporter, permease protein BtuC [Oscillospiraceae bacterium]